MVKKLGAEFYNRKDVVKISKELLGKILVTNWKGVITSGRIIECEACERTVQSSLVSIHKQLHPEILSFTQTNPVA